MVEQLLQLVVEEVVLMEPLTAMLVDQVVVALTANQEDLEPQMKDMLVLRRMRMPTLEVVELVLLLLDNPPLIQDHRQQQDLVE
tara:strand:- start:149 stop:400 length:252 start_codon:yes stop_codon:yes gene_type:complete